MAFRVKSGSKRADQPIVPRMFRKLVLGGLGASVFTLFAAATTACGGNAVESLCDTFCDCNGGCSDAELEECVAEGNKALEQADAAGCGAEYEDFLDCGADVIECVDGELDEASLASGCTEEALAFGKCAESAESSPDV